MCVYFSIMEISSRRNRKNNVCPWQVEVGGLEVEERIVVHLLSHVQLFATPGTAAQGFPVLDHLMKLTLTHIH